MTYGFPGEVYVTYYNVYLTVLQYDSELPFDSMSLVICQVSVCDRCDQLRKRTVPQIDTFINTDKSIYFGERV